jgi:predicted Holliday junction resolvase-like endonuclease
MIVFPGLAKGDPEEIVVLEVKTGKSAQLPPQQKKIRQLIEDGMVRWDEIHQTLEEEV